METLPHHYAVTASASESGDTATGARGLPELRVAAPAEFGGPGDRWSPETLLVAAVANCFILTFRAVAGAAHLPWTALVCHAHGTLDSIERVMQFTRVDLQVLLTLPQGVDPVRARRALERAERGCLVSRSLNAPVTLTADVKCAGTAVAVSPDVVSV
jgi:organic hydroperoxide reductase OsmC/OhrA